MLLPCTCPCVVSGLLTTAYEANPRLKSFFKVLALSLDNNGLPYISLMEARQVSGGFEEGDVSTRRTSFGSAT